MTRPLNFVARGLLSRHWRIQAWYIPLLVVAMGLMMLRPLLMARILAPEEFAWYSAGLLLSSTFSMLGALGLQSMLQRQMPMNLIVGKELAASVLMIQAMVVALVCAVPAMGLGLTGLSVVGLEAEGVMIAILHGLSQQLFVLATVESRSRGEPLRFSLQNLSRATLVVGGAVIVAWQLRSPTITLLVEGLLSLMVSWRITGKILDANSIRFRMLFNLAIRGMFKIRWLDSLALMLVMLVAFALTNLDRWLAASWLSTSQFALYAFAWILLTASQSVQSIINSSVYPSLARRYATHGRAASFSLAASASIVFLGFGAILAWPVNYALSAVISAWFAEYAASRPLFPIFIAIGVLRVSNFWSSYLIIAGQERLLLLINTLVGLGVSLVWFTSGMFETDGKNLYLQLAWFALVLTILHYFCALCAAFRFRR